MTNKEKFKELYIEDVIVSGSSMGDELLALFDVVLAEFEDDPEKMSGFIQSIIDENTPHVPTETEILQNQVAQLAFKLMQLESEV
ncbi:hypothetical protein [Enterococcus gallinarum]|uniref:hypothetical protein n=1 Tax=Enterococcus gallinarum TaxID=1353 RepID=UPI001AD7AB70|nr:hypothetical protein [Enterococcus gallinarum]MBO6417340.1 hypothetical protein [Enterococcus gallinarum]MBO6423415.1 hypothetical protein [Enterococcus gallinarum]